MTSTTEGEGATEVPVNIFKHPLLALMLQHVFRMLCCEWADAVLCSVPVIFLKHPLLALMLWHVFQMLYCEWAVAVL